MNSTAQPIPFGRSMLRKHRHVWAFFSSAVEEYETLLPFGTISLVGCAPLASTWRRFDKDAMLILIEEAL